MTTKDRVATRPADAKVTGTWASVPARRVAYAVKEGPLHVDGVPGPAGEGARGVSFSADGKHIGYYLKRGAEGHFVCDSESRGVFAGFGMLAPVWSDDATARAAFTARKVDAAGKSEWWIVVDGEARFGPFTDDQPGFGFGKSKLAWSPRGLAYVAVNGDSMRVELDGQPIDAFSFSIARDPTFSPVAGSPRCAYRARRDDKWWMVDGEKVLGPFDDCDEPIFSPDGRLLFVAAHGGTSRLYVDGAVVEESAKIHDFAAGAAGYALIVADGDKRRVMHATTSHDKRRSGAFANLLGLVVTPDGAHTCAVADKGGQEHVLVDGAVIASRASGAIPHGTLSLSLDGAHAAFFVKGKAAAASFVNVDGDGAGASSEAFDSLWSDLVFAPDGKSVTFMAEQGDDMFVFSLDAPASALAIVPYAAGADASEATTTGGAGLRARGGRDAAATAADAAANADAGATANDSNATADDDVTANERTAPDEERTMSEVTSTPASAIAREEQGARATVKKAAAKPKKASAKTKADDEEPAKKPASPAKKKASASVGASASASASASAKKSSDDAPAKKKAAAKAKR